METGVEHPTAQAATAIGTILPVRAANPARITVFPARGLYWAGTLDPVLDAVNVRSSSEPYGFASDLPGFQ